MRMKPPQFTGLMKNRTILVLILLIAAFLRFYQLGINPPSLAWDEAALGYNAYSIGETGRDEFGRFLPYDYFASFGDYKPPLYVYAAVIPVKIFGLNEFAVRLPSALFGTLTVLITFFLTRELFPKLKNTCLPEIAAFFLAISPWHTQLSRAAWEANLALFFVVLGVWLFLLSLRRQGWFLLLSSVAFVATLYTFNSTRIFSPLLVLGLLIWQWRKIWQMKKWVIAAGFLAILLTYPLIPHLLSPEGKLRFQEVNIFTDISVIKKSNSWIARDDHSLWSKVIHNRRVLFSLSFLEHYFHHFEGKFLFISGDGNPKFSLQDIGQLYLFDLPFLLAGVYFFIRRREKGTFLIFWWLLAALVPAATARETPHALRTLNSLPTWQIITAYGFYIFLQVIKKRKTLLKNFLFSIAAFALLVNVFYYLHNYYVHYPVEFSSEWQYGYREAIRTIAEFENGYEKVVFTDKLGRPYIYFLFYKEYQPRDFWRFKGGVVKEPAGFIRVSNFDKYEFHNLNWHEDQLMGKTLFVMPPQDVPQNANVIKTIYRLDGEPTLVIFD